MGPGRAEADKGRPEVRRWDCAHGAAAPGCRVAGSPRRRVAGSPGRRVATAWPADTSASTPLTPLAPGVTTPASVERLQGLSLQALH
jgi:hypothetical protein